MAHSTGSTTPATIPHTAAETAAMRQLFDHVGSKTRPGCPPCVDRIDGCAEGARLRGVVSDATHSRVGEANR